MANLDLNLAVMTSVAPGAASMRGFVRDETHRGWRHDSGVVVSDVEIAEASISGRSIAGLFDAALARRAPARIGPPHDPTYAYLGPCGPVTIDRPATPAPLTVTISTPDALPSEEFVRAVYDHGFCTAVPPARPAPPSPKCDRCAAPAKHYTRTMGLLCPACAKAHLDAAACERAAADRANRRRRVAKITAAVLTLAGTALLAWASIGGAL